MSRVGSRFTERASWLLRLPLETPTIPVEDERTGCTLWLKLDYLLPSGCTKDRMATSIVAYAIASGEVSPSTVVVEASSGSTSIALSMVCATVGVPFRAYMPKTVSGERVLMIRRLGGEVVLTPAEQGMDGAVAALLHDAGTEAEVYAARQFENPRNVFAHQHSTGPELIQQVGVRLDGFVAGVGTGGTLMGVAHALRDHGYDTPTAGGGTEVVGGIPGIVEGMSRLLDPGAVGLDERVLVPEAEAIATAREFGRRGLGVGPSSGLNIAAARRLAARLGPGHHVATILPDRMERYFSTALFDDVEL
jgi:cysteine synthase A